LKAALEAAEKKKDTEQDEKNTSDHLTLRLRTKNKMRVFDLMNGDGACHGDGANNTEETAEVCLKGQLYEILGLLKHDVLSQLELLLWIWPTNEVDQNIIWEFN
jgi:hypothetical protein